MVLETDLTITTGAGSHVTGGYGIGNRNTGTGALSITANGDVTGTISDGIYAQGMGTNLTITTGASSHITGTTDGISALNHGTGALSVTANGDVTGTNGPGISAHNYATGADLTVTTGVGSTVLGATDGIFAKNEGTGALSIVANGDVTGTSGNGIYAYDHNHVANITVAHGGTVSGVKAITSDAKPCSTSFLTAAPLPSR